jgi:hypothetical protein
MTFDRAYMQLLNGVTEKWLKLQKTLALFF